MPDSYYNTPVLGMVAQERFEAAAGHAPTVAGQFDKPFELRRLNRHGFTIITKHYSQASVDYALAEAI